MLKKWWFWTIILIIIVVISFVALVGITFISNKDDYWLNKKIHEIYENSNVYTSKNNNTIFIELHYFDNDKNSEQLKEIIQFIKKEKANYNLENYDTLKTISYLINDDNEETMAIIENVDLNTSTIEETCTFILFEEYEKLYNSFESSMELLNSIY